MRVTTYRAMTAALLAAAFCLSGGEVELLGQGGKKVDIRGQVTRKNAGAGNVLAVVLIEGKKEAGTGFDKASAKVTRQTKVWKRVGGEKQPAKVDELRPGVLVEAVFTGPVLESYPVQVTAGEIVILAAKD